jgi:hypothetical protein
LLTLTFRFAQQARFVITPGQSLPADVKTSLDSLHRTASTITTTSDPTAAAKTEAETTASLAVSDGHGEVDQQDDPPRLPIASVAGIVMGSLSLLVLATGLFW